VTSSMIIQRVICTTEIARYDSRMDSPADLLSRPGYHRSLAKHTYAESCLETTRWTLFSSDKPGATANYWLKPRFQATGKAQRRKKRNHGPSHTYKAVSLSPPLNTIAADAGRSHEIELSLAGRKTQRVGSMLDIRFVLPIFYSVWGDSFCESKSPIAELDGTASGSSAINVWLTTQGWLQYAVLDACAAGCDLVPLAHAVEATVTEGFRSCAQSRV
jgi:hypothetical protein